jgi:hypothetical protein
MSHGGRIVQFGDTCIWGIVDNRCLKLSLYNLKLS